MRQKGFKDEEELASAVALPVLASIPAVPMVGDRPHRGRRALVVAVLAILLIALGAGYGWWRLQL